MNFFDKSYEFFSKTENITHLLNSMADPMAIICSDGLYLYANASMIDLAGKDLRGTIFDDPSNYLLGFSSVPHVRHTKMAVNREEKIGDKYYSIITSPVFDEDGEIEVFVEIYHDITVKINLTVDLINANKKMNDDIQFAQRLQTKILPKELEFKNIRFKAHYQPSERLSGDFYDVIPKDDKICFYIADVMGHGVSASMMTIFIRQTIRSIISEFINPIEVLSRLREEYSELNLGANQYFTLFYAVYDPKNRRLEYANAGHNAMPILFNEKGGELLMATGVPVSNALKSIDYKSKCRFLKSGDKLLFYTDGITEIKNADGDYFGDYRLLRAINNSEGDIIKNIIYTLQRFSYKEMEDDIAMILVEVD